MDNIWVLFSYLKDKRKIIGIYFIFIIIFTIVFSLYTLPLETIFYASLLCLFILFIIGIYDFYKYYNDYKNIFNAKHNITATLSNLPNPRTLKEKSYQELIETLYNDKTKLATTLDKKNTDLIEYFTTWTHQIKTPLTAIDLLLQSIDLENKEEFSNEVFEIEEYVDMALQYLRVDSISCDLQIEEYSLIEIVKKAIKSYSKIFIYKKIKLNLEDIDTKVLTDEKWLLFVLKQILSNLLKYTYRGEISIYTEEDKVLVIEDTGIGISKEDIPRIFERGFTGYTGRVHSKSTGIGLYLSKRILDKLSHSITISSKVGEGTIVKIDLSIRKLNIQE